MIYDATNHDHEVKAPTIAHGEFVMRGVNGEVTHSEFRMNSQEYDEFTCECGAKFETRSDAEHHIEQVTQDE